MELAELMRLRPQPGAGLLMTLTRRCPLHCAHCSSGSTMASGEPEAADLLRFVRSFTADDRPEVVMLTGGEPLLLPDLVVDLAREARLRGTRTALLSGAFFAAGGRIPDRVARAVRAVDHFSVSLDVFHEREIARADVLRMVGRVLDWGIPASFHLTGRGAEDPYLADVTAEIRRTFADRVPMLVNSVRPLGRAASWAAAAPEGENPGRVQPCSMAAWPVVAPDGTVLACCNQQTVDRRPAPPHLRLGHIGTDGWPEVRRHSADSPVLRMVRSAGPAHLLSRAGPGGEGAPRGYCAGCRKLSDLPAALGTARRLASGAAGALLDRETARHLVGEGPVALMRRHGVPVYAELVALPGSGVPEPPLGGQAPPGGTEPPGRDR